MLYTKQLLARYISGSVELNQLTTQLTTKVCEVEEARERILPERVVIGKVTETKKHPDADKLTVCQLDCGVHGSFQICTGATNIREYIYVPVALPGCTLPAINLTIEPRMMRGLESNGMICSKEELGIGEDVGMHGIWILQDAGGKITGDRLIDGDFTDISDAKLGTSLGEYAPRLENRILDIENKTITHRPDLFGHRGIAREYNALFADAIRFSRLPLIADQLQPAQVWTTLDHALQSTRSIVVESPFVGSYAILELSNIIVKESSLRQRLQILDLGLGTKNNWIDFGTYFMYLTGQPIHCFDADRISGTITVRQAVSGEQFIDLFDTQHTLTDDDIVITDEKGIVALAGIIGAKGFGIHHDTKNVTIEIAQFDPVVVRKTAMRLGIRTDAATRYEKHIYPHASLGAVLMCLDELNYLGTQELGSWNLMGIAKWIHAAYEKPSKRCIEISPVSINRLLGSELSATEMKMILERLGCSVNENCTKVYLPIWRGTDDLANEADICEEIARIHGFDTLDDAEYTTDVQAVPFSSRIVTMRRAEELFSAQLGYSQGETYPWIHDRWHDEFAASGKTCMTMENSMTPEQTLLRHTMVPSLLEMIEKNAPFFPEMRLFDIGSIWQPTENIVEKNVLCAARVAPGELDRKQDPFLLLKQDIVTFLAGWIDTSLIIRTHSTYSRAHSRQQTDLFIGDVCIGTIARIHPRINEMIGLDHTVSVVVAHITLDFLTHTQSQLVREYSTLQEQLLWRDISFVLNRSANYGTISDALIQVPTISSVELLDIYSGSPLGPDEKSISLRFLIKGDGTMTTEQISQIMTQAIAAGERAGGRLR